MTLNDFLTKLNNQPEGISFEQTMQVIEDNYDFQPTAFTNGPHHNEKGTNEGSCKIFAFASMHQLTDSQTLACFGDYYKVDVLQNSTGTDHQNIRQFIKTGLSGIHFSLPPLKEKSDQ